MNRDKALEQASELALPLLPRGWSVIINTRAKRRLGQCSYDDERIELSAWMVDANDWARVRNTLLHEVAHALTPWAGHGRAWKLKCLELGIPEVTCSASADSVQGVPKGTVAYACEEGQCVYQRFRRYTPVKLAGLRCRAHHARLEEVPV